MAGEIAGSIVPFTGAVNTSAGLLSTPPEHRRGRADRQHPERTVIVNGAAITAAGFLSTTTQKIGGAEGNGQLKNSTV